MSTSGATWLGPPGTKSPLMARSTLTLLEHEELRGVIVMIVRLLDFRVEHGIPADLSLEQAIEAGLITNDAVRTKLIAAGHEGTVR
jgi:hypothetical protein